MRLILIVAEVSYLIEEFLPCEATENSAFGGGLTKELVQTTRAERFDMIGITF